MNPERWEKIKEVLGIALELPRDRRAAFIKERCGGDDALRSEIEILLQGEGEIESAFLEGPSLVTLAASVIGVEENSSIGRRLGAYQVVEQIGAGGMGEVYRAFRADDQYRKEVALKVIRAGHDSGFVIARFKNERQILAGLEHPNIARLLDGGTTEEGLPFFAMELIEGEPITDYCDHHKFSVTERIQLFLQVCSAVQFAHQHLVIHRDIKPGNILVTADGVPKLLDFGIAKIIEPEFAAPNLDVTSTAFRVLTPKYGSPEQMQGGQMTTASDVYSLGVVLYEMLTGRSPYRFASSSPQEILKAVCSTEPQKPSLAAHKTSPSDTTSPSREELSELRAASPNRLRKQLNGDLDNILLKTLEKDPLRRYRTVDQLQDDLRRHLENLPISARTAGSWYRASRFVIRNKVAVVFSTALAVALLLGMAVSLHEARVARQQRAKAEARFNDVRKLANSLLFEIHDSIRDLSGATPARKLLVSRGLEYLDSLSKEAAGDVSLQRELAAAYDRVGDLQGYSGAANLGDYSAALQSYQKALAIREAAAAANPNDASLQSELLNDYFRLSFLLRNAGDNNEALTYLHAGFPIAEKLAHSQADPKYTDLLAGIYWQTGWIQHDTGKPTDAVASFRQAVSVREKIAGSSSANPFFRTHLAADYGGLAAASQDLSDSATALDASKKGLSILLDLSHADPNNATLREYVAEAYNLSAPLLDQKGDIAQALQYYRAAHEIFAALFAADPDNALARNNLGFSNLGIARELLAGDQIRPAIAKAREALPFFEPKSHASRYDIDGQAESYEVLGLTYDKLADQALSRSMKLERCNESRTWFQKSEQTWERVSPQGAQGPEFRDEADRVRKELSKCIARIAELTAPGHTGDH